MEYRTINKHFDMEFPQKLLDKYKVQQPVILNVIELREQIIKV